MAWLELDIKKVDSGAPSQAPFRGVPGLTCTATKNAAENNGATPAAYTIAEVPIPPKGKFRLVPHASGWS